MIKCAAIICKYNENFRCTLPDVEIGFDGKCTNFTLEQNSDGLAYKYTPTTTDMPSMWMYKGKLPVSHISGNYDKV